MRLTKKVKSRFHLGLMSAAAALVLCPAVRAQGPSLAEDSPEAAAPAPAPAADPFNEQRILGVMPDYQTVRDPSAKPPPLTKRQKWQLAWKEAIDPFNVASAVMTAGFSQLDNDTPKYGKDSVAYGERFGAAFADFTTQNFLSAGLLASVLHQDPRYYRRGPGSGFWARLVYSASRIVITRNDAGQGVFNTSNLGGMVLGIAASNAYYPPRSVRWNVMAGRLETSLLGSLTGNLMSEFWPDVQKKVFHHRKP